MLKLCDFVSIPTLTSIPLLKYVLRRNLLEYPREWQGFSLYMFYLKSVAKQSYRYSPTEKIKTKKIYWFLNYQKKKKP